MLVARTVAEAHLYMDLQGADPGRPHKLVDRDGTLVAVYDCRIGETRHTYEFQVLDSQAGLDDAIVLGGTLVAWARARGPYAVMAVGVVTYTTATVALMYGMTRFRLPLEPLWLIYLAWLLAEPRAVLRDLSASPGRAAGAVISLPVLAALMLRYLPTGFPMFW